MTYWHGHGMDGWGFGLTAIGMLLFWGLLVLGGVALVRYLGRLPARHPTTPPAAPPVTPHRPEQLLAERYARGEIDTDEYRHRLDTLHRGPGSSSGTGSSPEQT